jgi:hypothetical protein
LGNKKKSARPGQPLLKTKFNVKEWSGSSHSQASAFDTIMLCPFSLPWRHHRPAFSSGIAKPHLTSSLQE